ncbi:MAG: serine hydrolase [Planctomycetota bacterium]|nr:serine hydrolase [Planctomycetota bacterium]
MKIIMRFTTLRLIQLVLVLAAGSTAYAQGAFPSAAPQSQGLSSEALRELAEVVRGYVEKDYAVGAELLVIKNRRTVLHEVFGQRDRENHLPWQPNTICNIRSMTKPLTGAAIQLLIDRGKLKLTDRAAQSLPGFDTDQSRVITIEQLLTHRSGLPLTILSSVREYDNLIDMANAVGEVGPEFEPGTRFWYSDAGMDVLGAIVEVVSGRPLDEFVQQELLRPMGMNETFYAHDVSEDRAERMACLHVGGVGTWTRFWQPGGEPFYPYAWGSQTLYSSPRDYARFLAMWMDEGKVAGRQLLSRQTIARTLTPVSPMTSLGSDMRAPTFFPGLEVYYGQTSVLHVETEALPDAAPVVIGHSGSDGTCAWAWPELDLMVLYFTQSRGGLSVLRLEEEIDRLLIHPERAASAAEMPDEYRPYLGTYVADFGPFRDVEFTVLFKSGHLAVDIPGQLVFELREPDEEGRWHFAMTDEIAVSFDRDDAGEVTGMKLYQSGMTFELPKGRAERKPEPPLDMAFAQRCIGTYRDEEAGQNVRVLVQNEHLAVEVPGQPVAFELYPPDEQGLWALRLNAMVRLRFDEDEDGRIVSFTVFLPDGTQAVRPRVRQAGEEGPKEEDGGESG